MTASLSPEPFVPFFLDGADGPLFSIHYPPAAEGTPRGALLFVPPFAEEMNRARRMVVLQARRLAALGFHVLLLDLYGTGDSAGDFGETRWEGWLKDVGHAKQWLGEQSGLPVTLWGLRTGCLLAAEYQRQNEENPSHLLFWQPVANGQLFLTQFLRLKIAAAMSAGAEGGEEKGPGTKALRQGLLDGQALEIAGYDLSPGVARGLDAARLGKAAPVAGSSAIWLEVGQAEDSSLPPASQAVVEAWREAGVEVLASKISGSSFWSIEETTLVPALWQKTEEALLAP